MTPSVTAPSCTDTNEGATEKPEKQDFLPNRVSSITDDDEMKGYNPSFDLSKIFPEKSTMSSLEETQILEAFHQSKNDIEHINTDQHNIYEGNLNALINDISKIINGFGKKIIELLTQKKLDRQKFNLMHNQVISLYNTAMITCIKKGFIQAAIHFAKKMGGFESESNIAQELQSTQIEETIKTKIQSWLPYFLEKITILSHQKTAHKNLFNTLNSLPPLMIYATDALLKNDKFLSSIKDETAKIFIKSIIKKHWILLYPVLMMSCLSGKNTSQCYTGLPFLIRKPDLVGNLDLNENPLMPQYRGFLLFQIEYEQALLTVKSSSKHIMNSVKKVAATLIKDSTILWKPETRQFDPKDRVDMDILTYFKK